MDFEIINVVTYLLCCSYRRLAVLNVEEGMGMDDTDDPDLPLLIKMHQICLLYSCENYCLLSPDIRF